MICFQRMQLKKYYLFNICILTEHLFHRLGLRDSTKMHIKYLNRQIYALILQK